MGARRRKLSDCEVARIVAAWNDAHPIGTTVTVHYERHRWQTVTTSEAFWHADAGTPCIRLAGQYVPWCLEFIDPRPMDDTII